MPGYRLESSQEVTPLTAADAAQVWQIDDPAGTPVYVDMTTEFNGGGSCDPWPTPEGVGDQMVVMYARPVRRMRINISTAGIGGTLAVKYWDGSAWQTVANLTDGTTGLTAGTSTYELYFDTPSDEEAVTINSVGPYYAYAFEVATGYSTQPVLAQGWILRGTPIAIPTLQGGGGEGQLRMYLRNTDAAADAYLVAPGEDNTCGRRIDSSDGVLQIDKLDHRYAATYPPELYSEDTAPDPVCVDIDVVGSA